MASQIPSIETLRWICWEPCCGQSNHVSTVVKWFTKECLTDAQSQNQLHSPMGPPDAHLGRRKCCREARPIAFPGTPGSSCWLTGDHFLMEMGDLVRQGLEDSSPFKMQCWKVRCWFISLQEASCCLRWWIGRRSSSAPSARDLISSHNIHTLDDLWQIAQRMMQSLTQLFEALVPCLRSLA